MNSAQGLTSIPVMSSRLRRALGLMAAAALGAMLVLGVFGACSQSAQAATAVPYSLYFAANGQIHKDSADGDIVTNVPGVSWSYDGSNASGTLALNSCEFTSTSLAPTFHVPSMAKVTFALTGENTVSTMGGTTALYLEATSTTITGSGSLIAAVHALNDATNNAYGIDCEGSLTVDTATVQARVTVGDGTQNTYGIHAKSGCTFTDATVNASYFSGDAKAESLAIVSSSGTFTSTNSTVTAASGNATAVGAHTAGIYALSNIQVSGGRVTAQGGDVTVAGSGAVSGSSEGMTTAGGLLEIANGATVSAASGDVSVQSTNSGAATAISRGVLVGMRSSAKKYCKISGAATTVDVTAGDAVARGGSASSCNSMGINIVQETYVQLQITNAHVTLRAGDAGTAGVATTDCGSYGFYGSTATYLTGGYLDSVAGSVTTTASAAASGKYIASYGYMGSVSLEGTVTLIARGGPLNTQATLTKYDGSFGWGVAPGSPMNSSGESLTTSSAGATADKLLVSGYTKAASYYNKVLLGSSFFGSCKRLVGDDATGANSVVWDGTTSFQNEFGARKYIKVEPVRTIAVPAVTTSFVYDNSTKTAVAAGNGYALSGTASAVNAGSYTVTATLEDPENSVWADGTVAAKTWPWTIEKRTSSVTLGNLSFVYNSRPVVLSGASVSGTSGAVTYKCYSNEACSAEIPIPTNAGRYYIKAFAAEDDNNTAAESNVATLIIAPASVAVPTVASSLVYDGAEHVGVSAGSGYTLSGTTRATNAGTYTATATLDDSANTVWQDGENAAKTYTWSIAPAPVSVPTAELGTVYTGSPVTGVQAGTGFVLEDNVATDVGEYVAIATLVNSNYIWQDGSTAPRSIPWVIYRYPTTITIESMTCTYDGRAHEILPAKVSGSTGAVVCHYYDDAAQTQERASAPVNAGVYYVCATVEAAGDYASARSNVATLTINKAENALFGAAEFKLVGKVGSAFSFGLGQSAKAGALTYSSSAPGYVTVNAAGVATIVKNYTGVVTITVYASGNANYKPASRSVTVRVRPGKMAKAKVKNVKKRSAKVSWTKMAGADSYQVQIALNSKFTKAKKAYKVAGKLASKKIKKLKKGKSYYVRVRAYDKQTASWGAWSSAKKLKIRK